MRLKKIRAIGESRKKTGIALLATGLGFGVAAFGLSFLLNPKADIKMIGDQIVIDGEISGPHLTGPKGETGNQGMRGDKGDRGDQGIKGDKGDRGDQGSRGDRNDQGELSSIKRGDKMTGSLFENSIPFKTAQCSGQILSHFNGVIEFSNGTKCTNRHSDGSVDKTIVNYRHNGDEGFCNKTNRQYPNGDQIWECFALHNGVVELITQGMTRPSTNISPLDDLFN